NLYDAALLDARVHLIEHAWFFASALVFWSVVIDPEPFRATLGYGARLPYLLVLGAAQNTVLGGILSFSSRLLYTAYASVSDTTIFDMDRVTDQRVGGAIMWVVGDFVFLAAASVAFFLWLAEEGEMQKRRERIASRWCFPGLSQRSPRLPFSSRRVPALRRRRPRARRSSRSSPITRSRSMC